MDKLLVIQPISADYRRPLYTDLAAHYRMWLAASGGDKAAGHSEGSAEGNPWQRIMIGDWRYLPGGRMFVIPGMMKALREVRPDIVYTFANPRCLTFWRLLVRCRLAGIRTYSHTQGPFDKPASLFYKIQYRLMAALSTHVVLYTPYSLRKIRELGIPERKFRVAENSVTNAFPVPPSQKDFSVRGVLFVGRLREECGVDMLCDSVIRLRESVPGIACHIVGGGELEQAYREKYAAYDFIRFYGQVYDQRQITDISRLCAIGCYPGDAGLSVVHYMSLCLPCLVHGDMARHKGPEPSYVADGVNGRNFRRGDGADLARAMERMLCDGGLESLAEASYATYLHLTEPSYAQRIIDIMEEK